MNLLASDLGGEEERSVGLRIALVTGANRGIGREVARQFVIAGMKVVIGARDKDEGARTAAEIGQGTESVVLDVSSEDSAAIAFDEIEQRHDSLDVLVNNAGIDYDTDQPAHDADLDRVRRALDVNLFGAWSCTILALPLLRGGSGRVLSMSVRARDRLRRCVATGFS